MTHEPTRYQITLKLDLIGQGKIIVKLLMSPSCPLRAVWQDTGGHGGNWQTEELGESQQRSHGAVQVSVHEHRQYDADT